MLVGEGVADGSETRGFRGWAAALPRAPALGFVGKAGSGVLCVLAVGFSTSTSTSTSTACVLGSVNSMSSLSPGLNFMRLESSSRLLDRFMFLPYSDFPTAVESQYGCHPNFRFMRSCDPPQMNYLVDPEAGQRKRDGCCKLNVFVRLVPLWFGWQ